MEVLTLPPAPTFRAAPRPRALRVAIGVSIGVHIGLVAVAVCFPSQRPTVDSPMVMVDVVAEMAPAPEALPPPPPPPPKPMLRKIAARPAPETPPERPVAQPIPLAEPPSESAPVVAAETEESQPDSSAVLVATAPRAISGSAGHPSGAGAAGGTTPPAVLSEGQRSTLTAQYRELMRRRIAKGFRYPPEARELELFGQVVVQVVVDRGGRVASTRLKGHCPHTLLCDDAIRTIRAAGPFAPIPRDLGDSLPIEVPLNYSFE
jgi:protein TonB